MLCVNLYSFSQLIKGNKLGDIKIVYHGIVHLLFFNFYISSFLFTASTPEETTPSQTVKTTSPPQTVGTTSLPQTVKTTSPPQTVGTTSLPQTVGTTSLPQTVGTTSLPQTVGTTSLPQTVGTTSPPQTVGTTSPPQTVGTTSPPQTVGTIITSGTVPVSNNIQPTTNLPSDGTTITSVITVVAVVIILVLIVVGVIILVVLFRAKKKQKLEINNLQNVTMGSELKQKDTTGKGGSSIPAQPLYEVMQKDVPLAVPSKSDDVEYLNQTCSLSEYKLVPANSEYAFNAKFPRVVNLSQSMLEELESNPMYQSMDQHRGSPSTANVPQGDDIYTVPDTTSLHTFETQNGMYEAVYSEPIHPSVSTDAAGDPSYSAIY